MLQDDVDDKDVTSLLPGPLLHSASLDLGTFTAAMAADLMTPSPFASYAATAQPLQVLDAVHEHEDELTNTASTSTGTGTGTSQVQSNSLLDVSVVEGNAAAAAAASTSPVQDVLEGIYADNAAVTVAAISRLAEALDAVHQTNQELAAVQQSHVMAMQPQQQDLITSSNSSLHKEGEPQHTAGLCSSRLDAPEHQLTEASLVTSAFQTCQPAAPTASSSDGLSPAVLTGQPQMGCKLVVSPRSTVRVDLKQVLTTTSASVNASAGSTGTDTGVDVSLVTIVSTQVQHSKLVSQATAVAAATPSAGPSTISVAGACSEHDSGTSSSSSPQAPSRLATKRVGLSTPQTLTATIPPGQAAAKPLPSIPSAAGQHNKVSGVTSFKPAASAVTAAKPATGAIPDAPAASAVTSKLAATAVSATATSASSLRAPMHPPHAYVPAASPIAQPRRPPMYGQGQHQPMMPFQGGAYTPANPWLYPPRPSYPHPAAIHGYAPATDHDHHLLTHGAAGHGMYYPHQNMRVPHVGYPPGSWVGSPGAGYDVGWQSQSPQNASNVMSRTGSGGSGSSSHRPRNKGPATRKQGGDLHVGHHASMLGTSAEGDDKSVSSTSSDWHAHEVGEAQSYHDKATRITEREVDHGQAEPKADVLAAALKWCHVQHARKHVPQVDTSTVKQMVALQLQAKKPIRAPWYRHQPSAGNADMGHSQVAHHSIQQGPSAVRHDGQQAVNAAIEQQQHSQQGVPTGTDRQVCTMQNAACQTADAQDLPGSVQQAASASSTPRAHRHLAPAGEEWVSHDLETGQDSEHGLESSVQARSDAGKFGTGVFIPLSMRK